MELDRKGHVGKFSSLSNQPLTGEAKHTSHRVIASVFSVQYHGKSIFLPDETRMILHSFTYDSSLSNNVKYKN